MVSTKRGALIVIEGCDCSGKTSQSKHIVEALSSKNIPAEWMCFPDRSTHTGKVIDEYLKSKAELSDQAIHLLFSANRWEAVPKIKQQILSGKTVVIDRYSYSGVAYSFAKKGSMDLEWYKSPERGLPKPDLVLYLNLDPDVIKLRRGFGDERYEKLDFQESVNKVFHSLEDSNWKIINADLPERSLTDLLVEEVIETYNKIQLLPLCEMW